MHRHIKTTLIGLSVSLTLAACGGENDGETTTVRGSGREATTTPRTSGGATSTAAAGSGAGTGSGAGGTGTSPGTAGQPGDTAVSTAKLGEVGTFTYKPGRDPFQSYFDVTGPETQQTTPLEPLQKHDLNKFKVTAIVTGTVQPAAILLDPGGRAHIIKRGTLLGPPNGRVVQILSDRVVVEREYKDRLERVQKVPSQLLLRVEDEESKQ